MAEEEKTMSWIAENWPMLCGFGAGMVAWGKAVTAISKNKDDIASNSKAIADSRKEIGEMKDAVARIETHQQYTREGIDDIRSELRELRGTRNL